MDKIFNEFLLTGDKFMAELHLKHQRSTYSAYSTYKLYQRIKNLEKQES